jgi:hypothetical protein
MANIRAVNLVIRRAGNTISNQFNMVLSLAMCYDIAIFYHRLPHNASPTPKAPNVKLYFFK